MNGSTFDMVVVGGGAAGMMAAITAAEDGARVLILEKNDRPCRKLYITGKGRCNVTNDCSWQTCLENTPTNPKFLFASMQAFPPSATMAFFERLGCPLKVERGHRVFPVSDQSASIIDALRQRSRELKIALKPEAVTELLLADGKVIGAATELGKYYADAVVLATGGASYPRTGSTGDGYALAKAIGHTILAPTGSLVPLVAEGSFCASLAGLSLRNVAVSLLNDKGKAVYEDFGEAEFTDYGLTGPTVLSASAHMGRNSGFSIAIDLKPALDAEKLDARLLRDLQKYRNCPMPTALAELYPKQLITPLLQCSEISADLAANSLTKEARRRLLQNTKRLVIPIAGKRPVEEAIITSGGIKVSEVNPKTMASKLAEGLYFAGEILDIDAYTGGFNLQIAWATGHAAGKAIAEKRGT